MHKIVYAIPTKLTCKKTMQILIGSRNILRNQCRQLGCLIYDISLLRSTCGCYHIAGWWVPLLRSSNSWGHRSWRRRWRKRCLDRVTRRHRRPVIMMLMSLWFQFASVSPAFYSLQSLGVVRFLTFSDGPLISVCLLYFFSKFLFFVVMFWYVVAC